MFRSKKTIKSELIFDSDLNTIEVITKLKEQFENFKEKSVDIEDNVYYKHGLPFKYKIVFYHDLFLETIKI
jgi:hypothetical protein